MQLLGGFELTVDDRPVDIPFQSRRLLVLLALHEGRLHRSTAVSLLWADTPASRAATKLRNVLWRLRGTVSDVIEGRGDHLRLATHVRVDVQEVERWARLDIDELDTILAGRDVIRLLGRELLPTWDDEWLLLERERLRQIRLHALESLSTRHLERGDHARAVTAALGAIGVEPLRESAYRRVIEAHLAEGNRFEAVRQFRAYQAMLLDELGAEPSPDLRRLVSDEPPDRRPGSRSAPRFPYSGT